MTRDQVCCPICGRGEFSQKISAIVKSGSFHGTTTGVVSGVGLSSEGGTLGLGHANMSHAISSKLASQLRAPLRPKYQHGCAFTSFLLGTIVTIILVLLGLEVTGVVTTVVAIIGLAVHIRSKSITEKAYPIWERSMKRWERLYYCSKDDVVFDPTENWRCKPESLQQCLPY